MICQRCLYRSRVSQLTLKRFTSTTSTLSATRGQPRGTHEGPPAATSTSAAQPFSTPQSPSIPPLSSSTTSDYDTIVSSVPAGTPLRGLGYMKGKDPPLAREVHEYPAWLWGLLDKGKERGKEDGDDIGDSYSKSKKERRKAARSALKAAKANPDSLTPKVPIEHQSIDLPAGDGTIRGALDAARAREDVRDALRRGRRKKIKEGNFLKAMR
ncbi:hypothetical protein MMC13_002922 [Lambiella insularis]|nr:hypothetical protein [Lambiella insularis]